MSITSPALGTASSFWLPAVSGVDSRTLSAGSMAQATSKWPVTLVGWSSSEDGKIHCTTDKQSLEHQIGSKKVDIVRWTCRPARDNGHCRYTMTLPDRYTVVPIQIPKVRS